MEINIAAEMRPIYVNKSDVQLAACTPQTYNMT